MFKKPYFLLLLLFIVSCSKESIYSGKIINQEELTNIRFENKYQLINKFGEPSYVDPIENKLFYFSEKQKKVNAFNKKTEYSFIFVFTLDQNERIIETNVYDLKDKRDIKIIKDETESQVVKRGLLEKLFGGVGPQQELPTTP